MGALRERKQVPNGADATAKVRTLETGDFDELAVAMSGGSADFRQMTGGSFQGVLETARVGECQLLRVAVNRTIQARGSPFHGRYAISLVTPGAASARWRGRRLRTGQVNVLGPEAVADHLTGTDYENVTVIVQPVALRRVVASRCGIELEDLLTRTSTASPDAKSFVRLERFVRYTLQGFGSQPGPLAKAAYRRDVDAECLGRVADVLAGPSTGARLPPLGARDRIARRADEVIHARLSGPLTILELCREVGVSARTLRNVFHDRFGMSPKAYLKRLQLNAVRRALKEADPGETTVHAIAQRWGFWHTGAFSADYRSLFGELPSDTLAKRA